MFFYNDSQAKLHGSSLKVLRMIKELLFDLYAWLRFPFYLVSSSWQLFLQWTSTSLKALYKRLDRLFADPTL